MAAYYVPSSSEWLLTFGVVGLGLLLFGLGEWLLPAEAAPLEGGGHLHDLRIARPEEVGHVRA